MKKSRLLVVAIIVAFSTITTAGYSQIRLGLRGEVGLNKASFSKNAIEVENLNSFKLGPTMEVMLPMMDFGVEASLLYNNDRMDVSQISSGENNIREEISITNHYIDIPVNLKYKFGLILPVKIYAAAGPYARIHVGGDDIKFSDVTDDIKAKAFEAGINLGLGVEIIKRLAVGVNYGMQLTDNYSADKPVWSDALNNKKNTWSIQATVYL
ncbi:MAG: porin family protein [Dysgonamonadaceae bacterium]|nr:porin family protein [Dysgonamonadaceae bacterium]MDD4727418.1 porin family protein [Dysgonamonadaceae bacterium]